MPIGGNLFLIAVGAILAYAVNVDDTHGVNIHTAGVILMIVGVIGLLLSGIWMLTRRRTDVVMRDSRGTRRTTYREPRDPSDGTY